MDRKPWPLRFLAYLHLITPLILNSFFKLWPELFHFNPLAHEYSLFLWAQAIQTFVLFPLAAYSIASIRNWSLGVYVACALGFIGVALTQTYEQVQLFSYLQTGSVIALVALTFTYCSIPSVRCLYKDSQFRWWENVPRYDVKLSGALCDEKSGEAIHTIQLYNLSLGGAMIECPARPKLGRAFLFKFSLLNTKIACPARIVHVRARSSGHSYVGICFVGIDDETREKLQRLLRVFEALRLERRPKKIGFREDLTGWLKSAFESPEAWVPRLPGSLERNARREI